MRAKITCLWIVAASVAQAQQPTVDRVLYLSRTASPQEVQEIGTLIRTIPAIRDVAVDETRGSIAIRGAASQIALAEWLFNDLDKPSPGPSMSEYKVPGTDDVVRMFHLSGSLSTQEFQEISTLARTIANIRTVFTENPQRALAIRGTAEQADLAAWLIKSLDPTGANAPSMSEYPKSLAGPRAGITEMVRVYRIANASSTQDFQAMSTLVRTIANIRTVFTENNQRTLAVRAEASQLAVADWLLTQLDQPAGNPPSRPLEYRASSSTDDVVGLLYLPNTKSTADFQAVSTQIRAAADIRTAFVYEPLKAVALRGTANQLALAERLVP